MSRQGRHTGTRRVRVALLALVISMALAAATALVLRPGTPSRGDSALAAAANSAQAASRPRGGPAEPLRVLSISPASTADAVNAGDPVRVVFSAALAAASPLPTFRPAVAGRWHATGGDTIVFTPAASIAPGTQVTLKIPAGYSGVRSVTGARLGTPTTAVFQAGGYSTLRLEQLLAQLGYLPLTWTPDNGSGFSAQPGGGPVTAGYVQRPGAAPSPPYGEFTWQGSYPPALTSLWQPGQPGLILTGAVMAFETDHGLPVTGTATRRLWRAVLKAAARGQRNPHGFTYALAEKGQPETLTVWHDGYVVSHGLANTGAAGTPTPDGTFPVYLRERAQVMRGLMPNGKPYADPVQFVAFFHGDYAVHSMDRASFGSPQSLGCVELPLSEARQVWPYLTEGSLVTVAG
jgi:peptidoglycan hydrolase-like protein with peptidoglycan-binding domain